MAESRTKPDPCNDHHAMVARARSTPTKGVASAAASGRKATTRSVLGAREALATDALEIRRKQTSTPPPKRNWPNWQRSLTTGAEHAPAGPNAFPHAVGTSGRPHLRIVPVPGSEDPPRELARFAPTLSRRYGGSVSHGAPLCGGPPSAHVAAPCRGDHRRIIAGGWRATPEAHPRVAITKPRLTRDTPLIGGKISKTMHSIVRLPGIVLSCTPTHIGLYQHPGFSLPSVHNPRLHRKNG
jgi:hypothetical protein